MNWNQYGWKWWGPAFSSRRQWEEHEPWNLSQNSHSPDRYLKPWSPEYEAWPLKNSIATFSHKSSALILYLYQRIFIKSANLKQRYSIRGLLLYLHGPGTELQFSSGKYCLSCGIRHFKFQIEFLFRSGHCPLVICYGRRKGPSGRMFTRKRYCSSKTLCHCLLLKYLCHFWDQWTSVR